MLAFSPFFSSSNYNLACTFDDPSSYFSDLHSQDFNPQYFTNHHHQPKSPSNLGCPPHNGQPFLTFKQTLVPPPTPPCPSGGQLSPPGTSSGCSGRITAPAIEEEEKKLHHNASERNRRKRINSLYASLRALLPLSDQSKKLSIPSTVGKMLKYIPELQKEVEALIQRKGAFLPARTTSFKSSSSSSSSFASSSCSVEATELGNGEISVQVSTVKSIKKFVPISEILRELEEGGGVVIDVSSSESCVGRVFHHIHLMVDPTHNVNCQLLKDNLLSSCQKWMKLGRWTR